MECSGYCQVSSYDLEAIVADFSGDVEIENLDGVLCVSDPEAGPDSQCFVFPFGVVVFWTFEAAREQHWLRSLVQHAGDKVDYPEEDQFRFVLESAEHPPKRTIKLPNTTVLTKLTISHAVSQSLLLGVFEKRLEQIIAATEHVPTAMALSGRQPLSRKKLRKLMGQAYVQSSSINLHFDLLDEPEFLWEYEELEPIYAKMRRYLDLESRLIIVNQKLDVVASLLSMISEEIKHRHSARLEWIIIWLIAVEVLFMLMQEWGPNGFFS